MIQEDAKKNRINLTEQGKLYPSDAKERVKARFLKECPAAGTDITYNNWKISLSVARGGVSIYGGAITTTYKNTNFALFKGKDGKGIVQTFQDGAAGAKRCCEKFQESAAHVAAYAEALSLGFNKLEAYNVLDDVMSAETAMEVALDVCEQIGDLSDLESKDAATLVRELKEEEFDEELIDNADEEDRGNFVRILQSQACSVKCKLFMAWQCIKKGIAFTEERVNKELEEGNQDYTALILAVSIVCSCNVLNHIHSSLSSALFTLRCLQVIQSSCAKANLRIPAGIHWIMRMFISLEVTLQWISLVPK